MNKLRNIIIASFGVLLLVFSAVPVQSMEKDGRPAVYNYVETKEELAEQGAMKGFYERKFQIIDVKDPKPFTRPKWDTTRPCCPEWDGKPAAGSILMCYILTADGHVTDPFVVRSSNPNLNEPELRWIREQRARPATVNGAPVATVIFSELEVKKLPDLAWLREFPSAIAIDAKGVRHTTADYAGDQWLTYVRKRVTPEYHHSDRQFSGEGGGLYRVTIDLKTGNVTEVTVVKSTGHVTLDANAVAALRKWQWKPGSWRVVDVPFIFGSTSSRSSELRQGVPSNVPAGTTR